MGNVLADEIKEMMGVASTELVPVEEAPAEVASVGAEPAGGEPTEPKQAEAPEEPKAEEGTQKEAVPAKEAPATEGIEAVVEDDWKVREAALMSEIERLSKQPQVASPPQEAPPRTVPVISTPQEKVEASTIFSDEALQEAFGYEVNLEKVRNILKSVHSVAVEDALRIMPRAAAPVIKEQLKLQGMVDKFYESNPEFEGIKAFVALVGNELEAKNPDWAPEKLFEETEKEVRNKLKMEKRSTPATAQVSRPVERKPAFAKGGGKAPEAPQLSGVAKEIRDLL